jgi:hypothetical protein
VIVQIAIITESFLPDVNGVAHCVLRVAEHLARLRGHHPMVIAPEPARSLPRPDRDLEYPVVRVPSLPTRLAEIGWLATKGTAWVLRRSIDLVPGLLALAIREWWSGEVPDPGMIGSSATTERAAARPRARQAR